MNINIFNLQHSDNSISKTNFDLVLKDAACISNVDIKAEIKSLKEYYELGNLPSDFITHCLAEEYVLAEEARPDVDPQIIFLISSFIKTSLHNLCCGKGAKNKGRQQKWLANGGISGMITAKNKNGQIGLF